MTITAENHWSAKNHSSEVRDIAQIFLEEMKIQVPGTSHYGYGPVAKIAILIHDTLFWDPPVDPEVATKAGTLALLEWREQHVPSRNRR